MSLDSAACPEQACAAAFSWTSGTSSLIHMHLLPWPVHVIFTAHVGSQEGDMKMRPPVIDSNPDTPLSRLVSW